LSTKLLFFCTEDWFVCSHWLPHVAAARDAGYEVHVLTRVRKHGQRLEELGLTLIPLELSRRSRNPLAELRIIADLVRIYRRVRPDLVQHIAMKPVIYGTLAALFSRPRGIVNYIAGLGWLFTSSSLQARLLRLPLAAVLRPLLKRGQVIVENPSDFAVIEGLGLPPARINRIPGAGVDMAEFLPAPEPDGVPVVAMACRMLWAKGVGEFVGAAELLKARGIAARFALIGIPDGENPSSVPEAQLEAWRDAGTVEWWGHRADMPAVFAECSLVCLPTFYGEGVPKVLIEAAAAGRPIVATQIPGCREIVHDGVNGLLVPPRNAPALADAIAKLLADRPLRLSMGRRGREIAAAGFSVERVVEGTLEVYADLLGGTSGPA
jgi:glycosyltransferase involved in cell wall biosynthesis